MEPEDLIRYGLIPEFVGRLPVIATLEELDVAALMQILTEPRNAVVKQYQKVLALDHVELEFTPDSLLAIVDRAMAARTGARALRSIVEEVLLDVMFEVPSQDQIGRCIVNAEVVTKRSHPILVPRTEYRRRLDEAS